MKTFFKINLILLLSPISVLFLILLFIRLNGISKEEIKTDLAGSGVYSEAVNELTKQVDNGLAKGESDQISALIAPIIKKEITPEYLQIKTEKLIDDTNEWMTEKNPAPPVISFSDLKEKILTQNAGTITMLEQLNKEYETQKEEIKKEASINGGIPQDQEMPSFDFNKIIKSDFSIPVGKNLGFLKTLYWYSTTGLSVIGIILVILLAATTFLSGSNSARLRWLGLSFLSSAIWNIFLLLPLFLFSKSLTGFLAQNKEIPSFLISLSNSLIPPLIDKYTKFAGISAVILLLLFITCLIASYAIKTPAKIREVSSKKTS